jgi:PEP-CTERM motif
MRTRLLAGLFVFVSALLPTYATADSIVPIQFSSGLPGWNLVYTPTFFSCGSSPGVCFQGNLGLGEILTVPAGTYSFSFLARTINFFPPPDRWVYVWWNGTLVSPTSTEMVGEFTQFTYSGLVSSGGNSALLLGFSGGCGCLKWDITTPPPPPDVPEPATLVLLGTGLGASVAARAKKRRRKARPE